MLNITRPHLDESENLLRFSTEKLQVKGEYVGVLCRENDWCDQSVSGVRFETAVFARARLMRTKMRDIALRDVAITNCDISNSDWTGASFQCVEVSSTRLTGLNGSEGQYRDVVFQRCTAKYAVFLSSRFERCRFEQCDLSDATFESGTLKNVAFRNCDLTDVRFSAATLTDIDLRGSRIEGIQIDVRSLREVTIDVLQTTEIAAITGARLRPLNEA
jgi:uncharacterized protein YjbI with pentapeptide repeats